MSTGKALEDVQALQQYLQRIQFPPGGQAGLPAASLENLAVIHRQHAYNIPFENLLFVHHRLKGTERPVDQASLDKRIVQRQRGGMCQEMNALMLHKLKLLGKEFDVCYLELVLHK
jgi:arylamine N-acetyltransferase